MVVQAATPRRLPMARWRWRQGITDHSGALPASGGMDGAGSGYCVVGGIYDEAGEQYA